MTISEMAPRGWRRKTKVRGRPFAPPLPGAARLRHPALSSRQPTAEPGSDLVLAWPGEIYSEKRVIPSPPSLLAKLKYYWDGLVANEKNKWMYLEFRGELSFVQEKLSAIHTSFFEMDERRELHDEFMLDKEGQELDDAVEKISEGFVQRMVEEVALMYRDVVSRHCRCRARFWRA